MTVSRFFFAPHLSSALGPTGWLDQTPIRKNLDELIAVVTLRLLLFAVLDQRALVTQGPET